MNTVLQATNTTPARTTTWPAWMPLLGAPATAIVFRNKMPAWLFMWALSFAIFITLKWMTWWSSRSNSPSIGRSIAYLFAWPGMDAEAFLDPASRIEKPQLHQWLWASFKTVLGVALLWIVARSVPAELPLIRGWIGLVSLISLLHFGSFELVALFWQTMGIDAEPIMSKPVLSRNLSEFWGKRWNLGFRQLAHDFIFRPALKYVGASAAGFLVFIASGLIHDLVISLPARGGYGLPTAYFVIQGFGVMVERSALGGHIRLRSGLSGRIFALAVTAAPAFWLFHPAFVLRVIIPFMHAVHAL